MLNRAYNMPNLLSFFRILATPVLVALAIAEEKNLFLWLLLFTLLTDALDGFIARHYHMQTRIGIKLDSLGDMAIYSTMPFCIIGLWPDLMLSHWPWVVSVMASFILPVLFALYKFGGLTYYHTWGAKAAAVLLSAGLFVLLTTENVWLFFLGAIVLCLSSLEEILITLTLEKRQSNISSWWQLRKQLKKSQAND